MCLRRTTTVRKVFSSINAVGRISHKQSHGIAESRKQALLRETVILCD